MKWRQGAPIFGQVWIWIKLRKLLYLSNQRRIFPELRTTPLNYLFAYQSDCHENRVEDKALDSSYHHRPCPQHPFFFLPRPSLSLSESSFLQIRWVVPHRAIRRLVSSEHPPTCRKHCTPLIIASRPPVFHILLSNLAENGNFVELSLPPFAAREEHCLNCGSSIWASDQLSITPAQAALCSPQTKFETVLWREKNFLWRRLNWNDETHSFVLGKCSKSKQIMSFNVGVKFHGCGIIETILTKRRRFKSIYGI